MRLSTFCGLHRDTEQVYEKFMLGSTDFASLSLAIGHALPGTGFWVAYYEDDISPFFLVCIS